ncbi:hypothetical protein AB0L25_19490 [Spirillospora sp. NPDC052242]
MSEWNPWAVKPDAERDRWRFTPLQSVGPLRFGMSKEEAAAALGVRLDDLHGWDAIGYRVEEVGVTLHFDADARLASVAADMRVGPQVTLDGVELVARVPSAMERWVEDYVTAKGLPFYYGANYAPGSVDLGFYLLVQRAGDHLLTRPLMFNEACADNSELIPRAEWSLI